MGLFAASSPRGAVFVADFLRQPPTDQSTTGDRVTWLLGLADALTSEGMPEQAQHAREQAKALIEDAISRGAGTSTVVVAAPGVVA